MAGISPVDAGLPSARSALIVERTWEIKNSEDPEKHHARYFLSSLSPDQGREGSKSVRGHWMVENGNHYKRDTCQWREDDHRHRRVNTAQNLALTRNALLAIIPFDEERNLRHMLDEYHRNPQKAIKLILHARLI